MLNYSDKYVYTAQGPSPVWKVNPVWAARALQFDCGGLHVCVCVCVCVTVCV